MPLSRNLETLTSWNPLGMSRPVTGLLYLYPIIVQFLEQTLHHYFAARNMIISNAPLNFRTTTMPSPSPHCSRHCPLQHSQSEASRVQSALLQLTSATIRKSRDDNRLQTCPPQSEALARASVPVLEARLLRIVLWDHCAHFGPEDGDRKSHRNLSNTGHRHSVTLATATR